MNPFSLNFKKNAETLSTGSACCKLTTFNFTFLDDTAASVIGTMVNLLLSTLPMTYSP